MSQKYSGGFITKAPVAPTTTAASGIWTLDQQQQAQKAGTWPSPPIFIEDLFSTWLYAGTNANQTIINGIDLSGQGGMVWTKGRSMIDDHELIDTVRGRASSLESNTLDAPSTSAVGASLTQFNSNGYSLGPNGSANVNENGQTFVSWTFRKQSKFFDIVTYVGDGVTGRTVAHSLGSVPGFIITKPISTSGPWAVAARKSDGDYAYGASSFAFGLNNNEPATSRSVSGLATDTTFTPAAVADVGTCNNNGVTYVAYLFAHNAGGFPASGSGSTNGISCGSYTGNGLNNGPIIDLGYEPQWLLIKKISNTSISDGSSSWVIFDIMRGFTDSDRNDPYLNPNLSGPESDLGVANFGRPLATGFQLTSTSNLTNQSGLAYVYVAIRRGPMKTPTVGTSVFTPIARTGTGTTTTVSGVGFSPDLFIGQIRDTAGYWNGVVDRLRAVNKRLVTSQTNAEDTTTNAVTSFTMDGVTLGADSNGFVNESGKTYIEWNFKRAPGFFDEVCYTGTEVSGQTFTHNLGVVPEMMIVKSRSDTTDWTVYHSALGASARIYLNATNAANTGTAAPWNSTTPTSSVFSLGNAGATNLSGATFVNYLFATVAGVSKVGSYTGTGALLTVNCGFTSGARFVLIKRTDSTGGWYLYDSARGITSGNDPYLLINSSSAETTGTNYVDTDTTGFQVTAAAPSDLNANGGSYIFLAIA
jgi:hypothetical protein